MRLDAPAVCSLHILWTFDRFSTGPWRSHFCAGAQWMGLFRTPELLPPHIDPGSDSHACVLAQALWNSLSLMLPQYFLFISCDSVALKSPRRWLCCGPLRSRPWDQQLQIFTLEIVPGNTFWGAGKCDRQRKGADTGSMDCQAAAVGSWLRLTGNLWNMMENRLMGISYCVGDTTRGTSPLTFTCATSGCKLMLVLIVGRWTSRHWKGQGDGGNICHSRCDVLSSASLLGGFVLLPGLSSALFLLWSVCLSSSPPSIPDCTLI